MSNEKLPPLVNGASHTDLIAEYNAQTAALQAGSSSRTASGAQDRSLDITCHLGNARAIADLVYTACGSASDGSDSLIDELGSNTLSCAMFCIMQNLDDAQQLHDDQERNRNGGASSPKIGH
jgi:hypothetical protein